MGIPDPKTKLGRLKLYSEDISRAAFALGLSPSLLLSLGYRETWMGYAPGYFPPGETDGWGDNGWAYGLFQIDRRYHRDFIDSIGSEEPFKQALYAGDILLDNKKHLEIVVPLLSDTLIKQCMIAGYNASLKRVIEKARLGRDPDSVTTGKDYSKYVLALSAVLDRSYPEVTRVT